MIGECNFAEEDIIKLRGEKFTDDSHIHNWRIYIPWNLKVQWPKLTDRERYIAYWFAEHQASNEEWD